MSRNPPAPQSVPFAMNGRMTPLLKATTGSIYTPTRPLGGWLATYAQIGPRGGLVPTMDRQGHNFEAARALGLIDFSDYLAKGKWNDTHTGSPVNPVPPVWVGVPTLLEFHDETTELAKAHRKVGFWTEGHLFDRADPRSWEMYTDYKPTPKDLERSDYFWHLATLLKGTPRDIGISAEGKMLVSPCGSRVIWAQVKNAGVCEVPQNPDATLQPLYMAVPIRSDQIGAAACGDCTCPRGACRNLRLSKAVTTGGVAALVPQDLEGTTDEPLAEWNPSVSEASKVKLARLVTLVMRKYGLSKSAAIQWVREYLRSRDTEQEAHDAGR